MRPFALLALLLTLPGIAQAQAIAGPATAIDGDSLEVGGIAVRLFGIDAPEARQTCQRGGAEWACGEAAAALLRELAARGPLRCQQRDTDVYGRAVSSCSVGRIDLADAMVRAGLAVPLEDFSDAYVEAAQVARAHRQGVWAGEFELPADYRAAHRLAEAQAPRRVAEPPVVRMQPVAVLAVHYPNCAAARAAGAAPLYRGEPGYRAQMDADGDGVACEAYRGR